ncbi:hypothetical protein J6590_070806 [Homalodisca vitripennis]|nr:hypothetical protein J6590_070806 [Homalodisca vitripennis]
MSPRGRTNCRQGQPELRNTRSGVGRRTGASEAVADAIEAGPTVAKVSPSYVTADPVSVVGPVVAPAVLHPQFTVHSRYWSAIVAGASEAVADAIEAGQAVVKVSPSYVTPDPVSVVGPRQDGCRQGQPELRNSRSGVGRRTGCCPSCATSTVYRSLSLSACDSYVVAGLMDERSK